MDRIIAFFDILGFRSLVMNEGDDTIQHNLTNACDIAGLLADNDIEFVIFSDTVVFYSKKSSNDEILKKIIEVSKEFVRNMLLLNIPIRGIITCGQFNVANMNGSTLFYGKALIEAYDSESNEKTIGVNIHPTLISKYDIILKMLDENPKVFYKRYDEYIFVNPFKALVKLPENLFNYNFTKDQDHRNEVLNR